MSYGSSLFDQPNKRPVGHQLTIGEHRDRVTTTHSFLQRFFHPSLYCVHLSIVSLSKITSGSTRWLDMRSQSKSNSVKFQQLNSNQFREPTVHMISPIPERLKLEASNRVGQWCTGHLINTRFIRWMLQRGLWCKLAEVDPVNMVSFFEKHFH